MALTDQELAQKIRRLRQVRRELATLRAAAQPLETELEALRREIAGELALEALEAPGV